MIIAILVFAGFLYVKKTQAPRDNAQPIENKNPNPNSMNSIAPPINRGQEKTLSQTVDPLPDALSRITKKPYGIFITPKTSPVQPERFSGYHDAVDLEMLPNEQDVDVTVKALCDGKLLSARTAGGYGGPGLHS